MRDQLEHLQSLLERTGEHNMAGLVERALVGSEAQFERFLVSNELWGGPGSIADQAGITASGDQHLRKEIEVTLMRLGRMQMEAGSVNPRTEMWVAAFEKWRRTDAS